MKGWGFQHSLNSVHFSLPLQSRAVQFEYSARHPELQTGDRGVYIFIEKPDDQKISNFSSGQCFHFLAIHWPIENRLRSMFHCCKISHRRLRKQLHCSKVSPHTYSVCGEADCMSDENCDSNVFSLH